jgi:hypothetical protein
MTNPFRQFWYKYRFIVVHGKTSALLTTAVLIHSMSFHILLKVLLICRLSLHLEEHFIYPKYCGNPHNKFCPRFGTRTVLMHVKRICLNWSVVYLEVTYHTCKKLWSAAVDLLADWSCCGCKGSSQQATYKLHQKLQSLDINYCGHLMNRDVTDVAWSMDENMRITAHGMKRSDLNERITFTAYTRV